MDLVRAGPNLSTSHALAHSNPGGQVLWLLAPFYRWENWGRGSVTWSKSLPCKAIHHRVPRPWENFARVTLQLIPRERSTKQNAKWQDDVTLPPDTRVCLVVGLFCGGMSQAALCLVCIQTVPTASYP